MVLAPSATAASRTHTTTSTTTTTTSPTTAGPPIIAPPGGSGATTSSGGTINYGPAPSLPVGNNADPECRVVGLPTDAQRACSGSGSALAPFPSENYGLDIHIDTGILSPSDTLSSFFQGLASFIFGIITGLLGTVFSWLGATFSFDLFSADHHGRIPGALHGVSAAFTGPFLPAALAIGGCWALWHWLRHSEAKALGHLLAMGISMIAMLILISDPVGILGGIDRDANGISGDVLAVFATGHSGGSGSFAAAEPGMWRQGVERPWCALEFGKNTNWCTSPVSGEAASWRSDVLANLSKADQNSTPQVQADERRRLSLVQTNGQLWLAFPPNDDARNGKNDSWTLYHHLLATHPDLAAIRGSGGVGARWGTLAIVLVGMIPFLLLLLYVALHLLAASIAFVLLLLLSTVAVFGPAFGERGRMALARWAGALLGSLALKVGYAAALGALILTSSVLGSLANSLGGSWSLGWGLWALLWVIAWLHRGKIMQAFTLGMHQQAHAVTTRRNSLRQRRSAVGLARGAAGRIGSIGPLGPPRERWREPGEWAPPKREPVRVPSWQSYPEREAIIEGHAQTLPSPPSEPPALPVGEKV